MVDGVSGVISPEPPIYPVLRPEARTSPCDALSAAWAPARGGTSGGFSAFSEVLNPPMTAGAAGENVISRIEEELPGLTVWISRLRSFTWSLKIVYQYQ